MKMITILTEEYADWETALLNAVARSYYGVETAFATPQGQPVTSSGGLHVRADMAISEIDVSKIHALVLNGGTAWSKPDSPDLADLLQRARQEDRVIAGICDATKAMARAGLLDRHRHTSNSRETLLETEYAGAALYQDQAGVRDGRLVTAPGTAPVSFMTEILTALGLHDSDLDYYVGLHAAEHARTTEPA
ncbi:glutamine amidotransferase [Devosia pacifica]|uniref:Glutamine amidotransferase n=1 Tax=Devosia pacifica TaxID=1335967 RepID=A0A918S7L5_9HYPH|nr:type 1 glutamine amidotransferase family protein [Devosia pacifica]GHA26200.1 glutamine amidotransferase [Devosia pacifica]